MSITLAVVAGPLAGQSFTYDQHSTFLVGRSQDAVFSLPNDDYLSRVHFLVEFNPPMAQLTDLGSRNGTKVNGQKIRDSVLRDGDVIEVGTSKLRVTLSGLDATRSLPEQLAVTGEAPTISQSSSAGLPSTGRLSGNVPPMFRGYVVTDWLGGGGMGDVYRAVRESDGKEVALKTIKPAVSPTGDMISRFIREADILRRLSHPNIVGFEELGEANGVLFFVMELVRGRDASTCVKEAKKGGGQLPITEVKRIANGLLAGIAHAHRSGYIHRDIKPGNVLVADDGMVKVADFGLARAYQDSPLSGLTLSGRSMGTPAFMPPEQVRDFRTVKPAGDQYSAGATIYFLLTGEYPHGTAANHADLFRKLLTEPAPPVTRLRPDTPAPMAAALARAMTINPEDRHADVAAFARALG
ncbi:protein kinase domain-containing protein [Zavarzinella formosa]|uniref:protein kinase domain-containing protein n=1 Tax=Zavarzinella formosa TaxID=360055 RepID=UPI0002E13B19|nr:FHA domain-containing serine/threonine-protein kinase [Zavarzinella formosa]